VCGIAGFCDYRGETDQDTLFRMTRVLSHRGPDDEGLFHDRSPLAQIGLGHRRLAVLDLSAAGHQPMRSADGRYVIVYNGEIYNFKEIADDLAGVGAVLRTSSDTEVILEAFARWGADAVHRFVGMFAFAIFDRKRGKLFLFRDRTGIKPLYYFRHGDLFLFASELKSFHEHADFEKDLDLGALELFLRYGFVPAPHTIFKHTYKLLPGHYLEIDLAKRSLDEKMYWSVLDAYNAPKLEISENEALQQLESLLISAFGYRMVSDVPVGVFLSSGYDSATVAAILQSQISGQLRTFTIGFREQGFDEAPDARAVAEHLGTDHYEHYCSAKDAAGIISTLPEIYDEPFADASAIPTILVSRIAREHVTVALSADGGDETFAGYSRYTRHFDLVRRLASIPRPLARLLRPLIRPASRLPGIRSLTSMGTRADFVTGILGEENPNAVYRHKIELNYCTRDELDRIFRPTVPILPTAYDRFTELGPQNDAIDRMLAIDYQTYLVDDVLVKVDRASMSVSLEGREPLLDHRIIEFAARLPSSFKYRNGIKKRILRELLHKYVPARLMDRPKKGFGAPIESWFRDEVKELLVDFLSESRLRADGLFDPAEVVRMRDRHLSADHEEFHRIWILLVFQMWKERWL
jgi:asparagine synthase (glutamine-hydrolysing)